MTKREILRSIRNKMIPAVGYTAKGLLGKLPIIPGLTLSKLQMILEDEQDKKNPLIVKNVTGGMFAKWVRPYTKREYNKKTVSFEGLTRTDDKTETIKLAKVILRITKNENKKHIQEWIDTQFEKKMDAAVQKFVADEFRNEILPILISKIDEKIKSLRDVTKGQVKECIAEVLSDVSKKLT